MDGRSFVSVFPCFRHPCLAMTVTEERSDMLYEWTVWLPYPGNGQS